MPGNAWAPCLAESWTASKDGLTLRVRPPQGRAGSTTAIPLTAEDVKFSFERYKGAGATTLKARVAAVEIVDPHRVRFRLKQPWPDFMTFYATPATGAAWIVPKSYTERVGEDGFKKAPVGAGPYRFVSFNPGVELVVEAYDGYWRKTPAVKRLVFKSVPDESTRLAMLKRGETDIAYSMRGPHAEEVKRTPGLTLKVTYPTFTEWLVFTQQWDPKSPWADRRVRLAANLAIDRKTISEAEYLGLRQGRRRASSRATSSSTGRRPPYPYDPARAKQLLAEAGYPKGFDAVEVATDVVFAPEAEAVINGLAGDRHPRAPAADGARRLLQGRPGQAVQAPRPRGQRRRRQRGDADRGVRDLRRASARTAATRTSTRSSATRPRRWTASGARPCCTRSSSSCTSARCSRPSSSPRCSTGVGPRRGGGAHDPGPPVPLALRGPPAQVARLAIAAAIARACAAPRSANSRQSPA